MVAWLAAQEWCNGRGRHVRHVVLRLQLAADRLRATRPALGAVFAIYASDDRWTDDVHWRGGALKLVDLVDYCHYMTPMCVLPPVPAVWGDGWARGVAAPAGDQRAVGAALAARGPARRLLAGRVGAARRRRHGLRADHRADHAGRRLGRRLPQQLLPHRGRAGRERRAAPAARRAVGARRPAHRDAGAADRPRRRDGGLVRPLAARSGRGRGVRLPLRRLRPLLHPARARPRPARGPVGAAAVRAADPTGRGRRSPARARCPSSPTPAPPRGSTAPATCRGASPADQRLDDARSLVVGRRRAATCRSSAIRACACGSAPTPRPPRSRSSCATSSPTAPRPWSPAAPSTSPSATASTATPTPLEPGRGVRRRARPRRVRLLLGRPATASASASPGPTGRTPWRRRRRSSSPSTAARWSCPLLVGDFPAPTFTAGRGAQLGVRRRHDLGDPRRRAAPHDVRPHPHGLGVRHAVRRAGARGLPRRGVGRPAHPRPARARRHDRST